MSDRTLPTCSVQYPICGACGADCDHDGDTFYCEPCGLDYGEGREDEPATFRDGEAPACGEPCNNSWHQDGAMPEYVFACLPCALPAGHTSDHWTDCDVRKAVVA